MYQIMGKRGPNLLQVIWRRWESNPGPFKIVLDIKTIELYDEEQTSTWLKKWPIIVIYVTLNGMFGGSSLLVYFFIFSSDKFNKMLILILIQYVLHFIRCFGHDVVTKAQNLFSVFAVYYWFYYVQTLVQQQFHKPLCIFIEFTRNIQPKLDYPPNKTQIRTSQIQFKNTSLSTNYLQQRYTILTEFSGEAWIRLCCAWHFHTHRTGGLQTYYVYTVYFATNFYDFMTMHHYYIAT